MKKMNRKWFKTYYDEVKKFGSIETILLSYLRNQRDWCDVIYTRIWMGSIGKGK